MNTIRRATLRRIALAALAGAALGAAAVVALADGRARGEPGPSPRADDSGSASKAGRAPDPAAAASKKQWVFEIAYRGGKATIERVRPVVLDKAASTARVMGRFAVEIYIGRELLDRVRFDVPLTGDDPRERAHGRPFARPTFDDVRTRLRVQIADNPRATRALLVDRATGETQRFEWPPDEAGRLKPDVPVAPEAADAAPPPAKPLAADAGVADAAVDAAIRD